MDLEVVSKDENQLLERTEVRFKATHADEGTPQRDAVREKLASLLKVPKERVVVDSMQSEFGKMETFGYAKVYKTTEAARKYEREHILIRNKLKERAPQAKEAPPASQAEASAEAKAEEKAKEPPKEKSENDKEGKKPN